MVLKRFIPFLIAVCTAVAISACLDRSAGPTRDLPVERLDAEGRGQVIFAGADLTPRPVIEGFLLLRAAEVALQYGRSHFTVLDVADPEQVSGRMEAILRTPGFAYFTDGTRGHRSYHLDSRLFPPGRPGVRLRCAAGRRRPRPGHSP